MKNKLYKTAKAVAPSLLLLLFLLPACSDESSNTPDIPETKYAKLTITLGSADSARPSYTKAMGDNDIFNTDSADLAHEHFIKDWWIVVMKLNNSSFSVDSIISNTTANNVDDDSETEVGMDLIIGETYKFYAFTNLDGLVTTDKDEVLNGLKGKSEADMLNLAVTMQEMDKYVKDATHTTPAEIPMSSYGYTHVITDDPNKNQLSICLFRLLGKVSIDVTNGTGKEVTLNKITMGKFRTTGQIFLFPYDATTNLGYEKGNLFVGQGQGDEYKLQSPDFPNENDADERTKGKDKEFELNQSLASNADKPYNYSFYINETSYKNQETNASDMTIALDVSGVEKDLAPKNTKFYFVRRNDLLKIPVLISDAREAYYEAQNSTIFPPSRKGPDDHDRIHLHSHESLLPAIWEARLCHGCKAAARGAEPQHGGPLCVPGVRHLRGGFRPLGQEAPLHSGQAEPRSAFCRRSGRQAPHPGILCHAAGGRLRDPRGDRGDQRLPPPSEKTEGDDNSAAGRGAGPADRGAAPGTGLPVRIFQMRHFRGSGAGILLPRE